MPIFRVQKDKNNPYIMINKHYLSNPELSMKAKGILTYLLSKPDDWKVYQKEIVKNTKEGERAISTGVKELVEWGYIIKARLHKPNGDFTGYEYYVYEKPQKNAPGKTIDKIIKSAKLQNADTPNANTQKSNVLNNNLNVLNNNKTEEEEAPNILQKIEQKFNQIFNRKLSQEFYQKISEYYQEKKIILKVLELAEVNSRVPKYILDTLRDWSKNGLESIDDVEDYLKRRQAQKEAERGRKAATTQSETPGEEYKRLIEEEGWQ